MRKAWKIVLIIVLVAVILAALLFLVGILTGADMNRIYSVLDDRYSLSYYVQYFTEYINSVTVQLA